MFFTLFLPSPTSEITAKVTLFYTMIKILLWPFLVLYLEWTLLDFNILKRMVPYSLPVFHKLLFWGPLFQMTKSNMTKTRLCLYNFCFVDYY